MFLCFQIDKNQFDQEQVMKSDFALETLTFSTSSFYIPRKQSGAFENTEHVANVIK